MKKVMLLLVFSVLPRDSKAEILWDQLTGLDSGLGFGSQDFEKNFDFYDCWGGDDFEVLEPGWVIESCDWTAYFSWYGYGEVHQVNFYVWPDRGDGYGDFSHPLFVESGLDGKTLCDGDVHYDFATPIILAPGHYTFGVQPAMDFAAWGQHFWFVTTMEQWGTEFSVLPLWLPPYDWYAPEPGHDASFRLSGRLIAEPGLVPVAGLLLGAGAFWVRGQ